ncbi:rho GTPase-activating protein 11A-like isoform X1 [Hylaeus anthracinus]|uniref:rho GTPase-activating protein 11A-like isoform X1 n=1 Tax=Hylaeus anthracinus TaxID=313031 RepID=UPI0023B8B90A|nr:rho GTPase-activating protein 11A-like isoform X1 [Hylaeus anthracinus]
MLIYDVMHKEAVYHSVVSNLRNYGVKYRFKKSMFKTERVEGIKHISKKVFKTPLSYQPLDVVNLSSGGIVHVPVFVSQAATFLEKHIVQEGLFRKAGSQLRQKELIVRLDNGGTLGEKHNAIDVANCLKTFFRDLPEPLIPFTYHDLFVHCAMLKVYRVQALLLACILLPPHHLNTLAFFMEFLRKVSLYEKQNKMSIDNLAKVIGPNIMPLQEATMSAVQMRLELHFIVVKTLIENAEGIGVLPDHIMQAISMETIGSTDNELDVSDSRSKSRKKKHRSGSLTRKPHLSASNLNLRMFNGLKKIVGKSTIPDDDNTSDNQRLSGNCDLLQASNNKSIKKRKVVERLDPSSTKKKRVVDKADKSKKMRLSLDRFVPRKPKTVDEDPESSTNNFDSYTERRWSSVSNTCDSERKCRTYSDGSSQLKLILKDNEATNELHTEYNNMFIDADVNLSDDSDEQVLLTKKDDNNINKRQKHLSSNSEELQSLNNFDQMHSYPLQGKLTLNNFETYSHLEVTSMGNESEEYVTIPKSEYEEIKNRVSAIESRLSQEFGCVNNEETASLSPHSVKKVQTAYEKTLEESCIESTATTDYLARKLGKELKIRRSGEHKIIRSPSARKIGSLRRRSQDRIMSKRVRRTASWHISHGSNLQQLQSNQESNNGYLHNEEAFLSNRTEDRAHLRPVSTSLWEEEKNKAVLNNVRNEFNSGKIYPTKHGVNSIGTEALQPIKSRTHTTVRRVSSFHGSELTDGGMFSNEKVEKLKKTNSQRNIILNNAHATLTPKSDWKKSNMPWKDAEGYFKSKNQSNTPVIQTGRASIAKLRTQNAGMVLAKAKLFDECTTKVHVQNTVSSKKNNWLSTNNNQFTNALTGSCESTELCRKSSKNMKNKSTKLIFENSPSHIAMETEGTASNLNHQKTNLCYYIPQDFGMKVSNPLQVTMNKQLDVVSDLELHQKENMVAKGLPLINQLPMDTILPESRLSMYKSDGNTLCRTPHIKKPLTVKTPKSAKTLSRKPNVDSRRTPLKAVSQLGTPKYQNPKSILKTPRSVSRHA